MFIPIAVETSGVLGSEASSFLKELGRRIALTSGEAKSGFYLQRVSMELQRRNAAAVLGTLGYISFGFLLAFIYFFFLFICPFTDSLYS